MSFGPNPSKPPTATEYTLIVLGSSALLIILGFIGLALRLFRAPQNPATAAALTRYSCWSLGIGLAIAAGYWLIRHLLGE